MLIWMDSAPAFFLPALPPNKYEEVYAQLAKGCGCAVPSPERRVYSITYIHNGERWTATVGQQLKGTQTKRFGSRGDQREVSYPIDDAAIVVAIFEGYPFQVVTDGGLAAGGRSKWENPFFAANPGSVVYFRV